MVNLNSIFLFQKQVNYYEIFHSLRNYKKFNQKSRSKNFPIAYVQILEICRQKIFTIGNFSKPPKKFVISLRCMSFLNINLRHRQISDPFQCCLNIFFANIFMNGHDMTAQILFSGELRSTTWQITFHPEIHMKSSNMVV